jgi:hypothetical protein
MWMHSDRLPACRRPQPDASDAIMKKQMVQKTLKLLDRDCMDSGLVLALTSFFAVNKGTKDIRMAHNGKVSGLNAVLWAPCFPLPTVESHLRVIEPVLFPERPSHLSQLARLQILCGNQKR